MCGVRVFLMFVLQDPETFSNLKCNLLTSKPCVINACADS